ncbi:hypothetical protein CDAR_215661 [Caerostris darwini]|uniref:Uncharacterized protein n=1 Tax=Caerostris darwini TaxID=1538125 RepID=A0AAV4VTF5_9ARAC|nr:hypothetical protein CDAR_215661 [Caerostris darwini]
MSVISQSVMSFCTGRQLFYSSLPNLAKKSDVFSLGGASFVNANFLFKTFSSIFNDRGFTAASQPRYLELQREGNFERLVPTPEHKTEVTTFSYMKRAKN